MKAFTALCTLLATCVLTRAAPTNIVVREYDVVPGVEEGGPGQDIERNDWKEFFEPLGVEWPRGSSIRHDPERCKVIVANTAENLAAFEDAISALGPWGIPSQVEVEAHFVAFDPADVNTIAMSAPTGIVDKASLFELRRQGKAELLFAPKVVTLSGAEATVKAVTEYRYPTEYMGKVPTTMPTNSTGEAVYVEAFEIREVGINLTLLPEVSAEGNMITLFLAPEAVHGGEWERYGHRGHPTHHGTRQPFFHTQSVSTVVNVYDGKTVVISGGMMDRKGTKMVYIFVTARLIGPDGTPCETGEAQ
jgi:type II secretory pathway component GspD/PulD (secretin)